MTDKLTPRELDLLHCLAHVLKALTGEGTSRHVQWAHYHLNRATQGMGEEDSPEIIHRDLERWTATILDPARRTYPVPARYRLTGDGWYNECSWEELCKANPEDLGVLEAVSALAVGDSCIMGGGAAPLVTVTRLS